MADERLCTLLQLHLNSCHPVDFTFVVSEQKDERIVYVYSAIHGIQRNAKANCAKKGTIFRNSTDFFYHPILSGIRLHLFGNRQSYFITRDDDILVQGTDNIKH